MPILVAAVWIAVTVASTLLFVRVSAALRGPHTAKAAVHDVYEAAFLSGGPGRVADAAIAALHTDGRISVGGPGVVTTLRPVAHDPVEQAVLDALAGGAGGALPTVRLAVVRSPAVQRIGDGLAARGLAHRPGAHASLARWGTIQGLVCVLAEPLVFALVVLAVVGAAPFPYHWMLPLAMIPALAIGGGVGFVQAARARRRVSPAGRRALAAYREAPGQAALHTVVGLVALYDVRFLPDLNLSAHIAAARRSTRSRSGRAHFLGTAAAVGAGTAALQEPLWCGGPDGSGPDWDGGSGGDGSGSCGGSSGDGNSCGSSDSGCGSGCGGGGGE
ncbi:TIGR04222 domain-containing membrane protein [Streptomyces sp. NPDC005805]|uniref:TIGR04222 domain-containing membrane protein n=1 Tax=Streptomyces sp. NPDC005805 TaxID=3157068 RepID=UPI00340194AE